MRDSTIRGLRTFCVAAKHASFKQAARELCVTPSAVSHQIKDLEELIGEALFTRETRKIELTDFGASLAMSVSPVLAELDQVVAKYLDRSRLRRILRVCLPQFFATEVFVPELREFTEATTGLEIRVDTAAGSNRHSVCYDASVVILARPPQDQIGYELFPLNLVPACSGEIADRLDLDDVETWAKETLIVHEARPNAWNDWFLQGGIELQTTRVVYLDSMFAVARAAERGLGVALVPVPLSQHWFDAGTLKRLADRELATSDSYYFVHRIEDEDNKDIRALTEWVLSKFASKGAT